MNNSKTKNNGPVKIDFKKIPKEEARAMARAALEGAREFCKNPKNIHAFNEWLEKRKKSQKIRHN